MNADTAESRRFISFTHSHVFSIINRESRLCSYRNRHAYTWYLWFWVCQVCCGVVCFWDDWADFRPESQGMASSRKTCLVWPTPSLAVMSRNGSVFVSDWLLPQQKHLCLWHRAPLCHGEQRQVAKVVTIITCCVNRACNRPLGHILASTLLHYCARWSTEFTDSLGRIAQVWRI